MLPGRARSVAGSVVEVALSIVKVRRNAFNLDVAKMCLKMLEVSRCVKDVSKMSTCSIVLQ